ncbi:MAG: helix-turn-helix domain-containing protein [Minwuia sp.]|uniref:helix-turn-helix domain-containing protein n=1 Tax=Minwuia sp. TaxID=2493630 RepID=UPI003A897D5C
MAFQAHLLKSRRKERDLSREQLSEASRVSVRTIARLENERSSGHLPRENTIRNLEKALDLDAGTLMGEKEAPPPAQQKPPAGKVRIGANLPMQYRRAYDLVHREYGATQEELIFLAPLLFTLAAESSHVWRRKKAQAAAAALESFERNLADHLDFPIPFGEAYAELMYEESQRDIWGYGTDPVDEEVYGLRHAPLFHYLRDLAQRLGGEKLASIDLCGGYAVDKCPEYAVLSDLLESFVEGSDVAELAVWLGWARIKPGDVKMVDDVAMSAGTGVSHIKNQLSSDQIETLEKLARELSADQARNRQDEATTTPSTPGTSK